MNAIKSMALCFASGVGIFLAGCSSPMDAGAGSDAGELKSKVGQIPPAEELLTFAEDLGASELQKLAAAELVYRNAVFEHSVEADNQITHVYGKFYRQFKDFEVVDIARTESILHPVRYTIRYDFDVLGTTMSDKTKVRDLQLIRNVASDWYFVKHTSDSLTRIYESDDSCQPINPYSPFLERLNYWQYQTKEDLFGHKWTMNDVSRLATP